MEYRITNHSHSKNFTIIPNELLQSGELSPFALGLLCYLLSLPSLWNTTAARIAEHFGEKEVRILRSLREIIDAGYCKRVPIRAGGRLRGQQYYITDIKGDFAEPEIFRPTEISDPQNLQTTENSDPQKNGGSVINNINQDKNIYNSEKNIGDNAPARIPKKSRSQSCLFEDSEIATWEAFVSKFGTDEYAGADLQYYYGTIKDWAAAKGAKYKDWIAFVRNWMRRDHKEGRLVRTQQNNPGGMQDWQYEAIMRDRAMDDDSLWRQD